jgi:hypothetical protein
VNSVLTTLILKATASHYGSPDWGDNDYVVLDGSEVVGRIMLHPQAPKRQPWMWTITARDMPPSTHNHGYADTREDAMAKFKMQWGVK